MVWQNHFKELLGKQITSTRHINLDENEQDLYIKRGLFTSDELLKATNRIQNSKAVGLDEIPAEIWKIPEMQELPLECCTHVYSQETNQRWTEGCLIPFPKKGDIASLTYYRWITLKPIAATIYNLMLLNWIRPKIDPQLRKNQNGFRTNRSTSGQILTIRRLLEGVKSHNLPAVLLFVDFSKAFDSIDRKNTNHILKSYGIPAETVNSHTYVLHEYPLYGSISRWRYTIR